MYNGAFARTEGGVYMLALRSRREQECVILEVSGPVDIYSASQFRMACLGLEAGPRCYIDLGEVTFMDTIGIGVLITFQRRLQRRGHELSLINPPSQVFDLLKAVDLEQAFRIYPSLPAALAGSCAS